MDSQDNDKCPACGNAYKVIYYQRRSADEPPDSVKYCSNCPLDTSKLSLDSIDDHSRPRYSSRILSISSIDSTNTTDSSTSGSLRSSKRASFRPRCLVPDSTRYMIVVEGSAAVVCKSRLEKKSKSLDPITAITIPLEYNSKKELVHFYTNSVFSGQAHVVNDTARIAPFVNLVKVDVYKSSGSIHNSYEESVVSYGCEIDCIPGVDKVLFRSMARSRQSKIVALLPAAIQNCKESEQDILCVLEALLTRFGTENNIKSFTSAAIVNSLYIHSGKAYDWPSAPESGFTYAWKPDGERFWYVKYGSVWLFCRRLLSGKIIGWNIAKHLFSTKKTGPVLDMEVLIGHDPIFIDALVLESGESNKAVRSLSEVLSIYNSMENVDVPIYLRDYFNSIEELSATKDSIGYPVDGIIGIQDGTMNIIKLKDEKSIELKLDKDGNLLSAEGNIVATSDLQSRYPVDSIIEIRFTKNKDEKSFTINETILRTDKLTANSYEVCINIVNTINDMPDSLARREAVLWCNSIRRRMNQIASKTSGKGRVILDIGAGDGQAVSDYSTALDVSYLLLEPDKKKCEKLVKRLSEPGKGQFKLYDSASQIIKAATSASTGAVKYAIVCATLDEILKEPHARKTLKTCVRYCISSFSISYVYIGLKQLALDGLNIIGCGYFYDNVNVNDYLVNDHGVVMKRISTNDAAVTWGSDKIYHESAIVSNDFKGVFNIRPATSLVPIVDNNNESLLGTISSKVFVISTKKYL